MMEQLIEHSPSSIDENAAKNSRFFKFQAMFQEQVAIRQLTTPLANMFLLFLARSSSYLSKIIKSGGSCRFC